MAAPPVFVAIRELGPTLTWVGLALLTIGAACAALLIFGPAHRRLRTLEQAARALGQGRTDVRAVEAGGDEVSSLAHTFNRMADDLSARAGALAASDRARRQLLADVSHELMTPLAAIRGYTETLAMPELTIDPDSRQRYLGIIGDETMKLEGLIGDLLDLARLEGGGGTMTIEDVPVRELFSRIADRHGPALRDRQIDLDVRVEPADLTVPGDAQKLEQALQNLAANAIRHTPSGGRLTLDAAVHGDVATFRVKDSGPGIPPEHLPHIFERFYKVDAARSASAMSGSGLGLSIVRAIVERHGGRVTAANAPDGGAVFEITVPRSEIPRRQTDVDADGVASAHAHRRRVGLESLLPHFDAVRPFAQLDDELIFAGRRVPRLSVDEDLGVGRTDAQQQRAERRRLLLARRSRLPRRPARRRFGAHRLVRLRHRLRRLARPERLHGVHDLQRSAAHQQHLLRERLVAVEIELQLVLARLDVQALQVAVELVDDADEVSVDENLGVARRDLEPRRAREVVAPGTVVVRIGIRVLAVEAVIEGAVPAEAEADAPVRGVVIGPVGTGGSNKAGSKAGNTRRDTTTAWRPELCRWATRSVGKRIATPSAATRARRDWRVGMRTTSSGTAGSTRSI